jgi:hypothetical protein
MSKIIRLTESDLIRLVKRVINEQSSQNNCNKFQEINSKDYMNDIKKMSFKTGSDTDEAKKIVLNSKKIYKFNGTSDEANNNLSCIGLTLYKSKNYDYYEPNLYSGGSPYIYIGVF